MKQFEIVTYDGVHKCYVKADDERQALCRYLMEHEDLDDAMLWKSLAYPYVWKLAEYDSEDLYLFAREIKN